MMEVEELLGLPKPIAELTDDELNNHLAQFFPATRPNKPISPIMKRAGVALDKSMSGTTTMLTDAAKRQAEKMAAMFKAAGIDPVTRQPIAKPSGPKVTMQDLLKKKP